MTQPLTLIHLISEQTMQNVLPILALQPQTVISVLSQGTPRFTQAVNNIKDAVHLSARRDHTEGLDAQGTGAPNPAPENPEGDQGETFRPALGLPIIQFFSSLGGANGPLPRRQATVDWEYGPGTAADPKGRFASPVLLRPHRDAQGKWHALVIFVDDHRWPAGKKVYLNGQERSVSLDLYEAMKNDDRLRNFLA